MKRSDQPSPVLLDAVVSAIHGVLGDDLVGLYLYGSAVTGGFDAEVSDLDLAAVTAHEIEEIDLTELAQMHARFADRHPEWRGRIDVVYIGRAALDSFRTGAGWLAVISPGEPFHARDDRVADWLQNWYLVRETGHALYGPAANQVLPLVDWAEFVGATQRYAHEVQTRPRDGVAGGILAYAILTMCRTLHVVRQHALASKQEAAAWTSRQMPDWAWLIDAALSCRLTGGKTGLQDDRSRTAAETFIGLVGGMI